MYLHLSKGRKNEAFQCRAARSERQEVGGEKVTRGEHVPCEEETQPPCYRQCDKIPEVPAYDGISN